MLGTTVGTYRITGSIGQGGMGAVYAAEHTLLGRPAAVKVLLPELSQSQEIVTRFFNEARAATAIRHPGIVEIYDFGWNPDGSAYIVMEYLQGESLAARLSRGRVSPANAFSIVRQIAGALGAAHRKNIIHRDLKPDNVFLVPDDEVPGGERIKLLDFGIAKLAGDPNTSQKTRTGSLMGTPTYMAPEQCRGVTVDHRVDLYALGCILFELISGRPPFIGEGMGDVLAAHIHVPAPALSTLVPDVPPAIEQLVQRLLTKDPAQRVQTAEEVIHAIDTSGAATYRTGRQVGTAPTMSAATMPTTLSGSAATFTTGGPTVTERPGSRRGLWIGLAAGVVAVGAVVIVLANQSSGDGKAASAAQPVADQPVTPTPPAPTPPAPAVEPPAVTPPAAPEAPAAPTTVAVKITSSPAGAQVLLGGKVIGTTPFEDTLPRADGSETLTLRLTGYKDAQLEVRTDGDISETVKLEKKRKRTTSTAGEGESDRDRGVNPFGN